VQLLEASLSINTGLLKHLLLQQLRGRQQMQEASTIPVVPRPSLTTQTLPPSSRKWQLLSCRKLLQLQLLLALPVPVEALQAALQGLGRTQPAPAAAVVWQLMQ
jgi:hypothetical protein